MRYDPNRHYLYPVARPFSDDYTDGVFSTDLNLERVSDTLHVDIRYEVADAVIYKLVSHADAHCIAMIYCVDTMYRYALVGNNDDAFRVVGSIPLDMLKNQVVVYPSVVAQTHMEGVLPSDNVNTEYEKGRFNIKSGQPLAFDSPWFFSVDPTRLRIQSIFRLVTDVEDKLKPDEFDIHIDPNSKYIDIVVDRDTRRGIEKLRSNKNITFPSLYLSSLVSVLSDFRDLDEDGVNVPESYPSDGWFWCIRHKLQELNIALSDNNDRPYYSLLKAAQQLLSGRGNLRPLRRLFQQTEVSDEELV